MKQNAKKNRKEDNRIFYKNEMGNKRVNIKKILGDPVPRKKMLDGAKEFLVAIGRYT